MKILLNGHENSFQKALSEITAGADTLSLAVSYLQMGGWELFRQHVAGLDLAKMRIVCTDQMAITSPAAVRRVIEGKARIRNYNGSVIYHPKVYIAHDKAGKPIRFLLGSANLSTAAFTSSVEAGIISEDIAALATLSAWFDDLFENQSVDFTPELLQKMEENWKKAAGSRVHARMKIKREAAVPSAPAEAEDIEALEDIFATLRPPIGLLNMDYAANNVRTIQHLRKILEDWNNGIAPTGKPRSELKLLGFIGGAGLTPLGREAAAAKDNETVAALWCAWLQRTSDAGLEEIHFRLPTAKRVFRQFWNLQPDVRNYFLEHAEEPGNAEKALLQTIEILCNASDVVQELTLDDIRALTPLLRQPEAIPAFVRDQVEREYLRNKGRRGWDLPDRRIVTLAWRAAQGA